MFMKYTLIDLFELSVDKFGDSTFLLEKTSKEFEPTSFNQIREKVYNLGGAFCQMGVQPKDNIAILAEGRNDWIIAELALLYAGAVSIPLSVKLEESNDLLFRLNHADVKYIIVSARQLPKIRLIKDQIPSLVFVVVLDDIEDVQEGELLYSDQIGRAHV